MFEKTPKPNKARLDPSFGHALAVAVSAAACTILSIDSAPSFVLR
jgi:hypothetical protein